MNSVPKEIIERLLPAYRFRTGSAELNDDGTIEIEFAYHLGDEAILKAEPMTSSTAC